MPLVDDPSVIGAVQRFIPVKAAYRLRQAFDKLRVYAAMGKNIIRRHAGLTRIHEFSPDDPLARDLQSCTFIDDHGAFPAEFERHGDKIFRCGTHHDLTDVFASGEKNFIEGTAQKDFVIPDAPFRTEDIILFKRFSEHAADDARDVGRLFGRAEHGAVPRGNRRSERLDQQLKGIVVRPHYKYASVRLRDHLTHRRKDRKARSYTDGFHPFFQVTQRVRDARENKSDFRKVAFLPAFSEIGRQSFLQFAFIGYDRLFQLFQLLGAICVRQGHPLAEQRVLPGKQILHKLISEYFHRWPPFL